MYFLYRHRRRGISARAWRSRARSARSSNTAVSPWRGAVAAGGTGSLATLLAAEIVRQAGRWTGVAPPLAQVHHVVDDGGDFEGCPTVEPCPRCPACVEPASCPECAAPPSYALEQLRLVLRRAAELDDTTLWTVVVSLGAWFGGAFRRLCGAQLGPAARARLRRYF